VIRSFIIQEANKRILATAGSCLFGLFGVQRPPRQILVVVQKNVIWSAAQTLAEFEEVPQARTAATLLEQTNSGGLESAAFGEFRLGDAAHFPQRGEASCYHAVEVVSEEDHRCVGVSKMHNKS